MKKRKPPIVLGTLLALFVAGAFGINYVNSQPAHPPVSEAPPPVSGSRPAESASNLASNVQQAMNSGPQAGAPGQPPSHLPKMPGSPAGAPLVMNPMHPGSGRSDKPKPNPSATSAQWYNDETAMSEKK